MAPEKIPLGEYLFRRIHGLGISHVFGCPGDFNLNLLDHLDSVDGLHWVGNRNELNGAYAADGYARSRGLPGVIVTTYGVGELSALNGISGACSEYVPIIHIVGTTARSAQKAQLMLHHTLGENIDHAIYQDTGRPLYAAIACLNEDATFTEEVDRVIEVAFQVRLPVYLGVPIDTPDILVDATRLQEPLLLEKTNLGQESVEDSIIDLTIAAVEEAQRPCVLVDLLAKRFGLTDTVREILQLSGLAGFVAPMAKSVVDETTATFGGLYLGAHTPSDRVRDTFESADLVIHVGRFPSDTNTGGWSQKVAHNGKTIIFHPKYVSINDKRWDSLSFVSIVKKLATRWRSQKPFLKQESWWKPLLNGVLPPTSRQAFRGPLKQSQLWRVFDSYLRTGDCIIAEVGTSQFGTLGMNLQAGCEFHTQLFYSCIGFTVGAALGTLVARKEKGLTGRVILFVGDGSLQMTAQEISTMIHNGFNPTIVVINNNGYTVERVIHGPTRAYNNIDPWRYDLMLQFFGASANSKSYTARTHEELQAILDDKAFHSNGSIQVLECVLDKYDSPRLLSDIVDVSMARTNAALSRDDIENNRSRLRLDGTLTDSGLCTTDTEPFI